MSQNKKSKGQHWGQVGRLREGVGTPEAVAERIERLLKGRSWSLAELSTKLNQGVGQVERALQVLEKKNLHVRLRPSASLRAGDEELTLEKSLPVGGELRIPKSRIYGRRYRFGFCTDPHMGSKYYRADIHHALYDWYAKEGVEDVYSAGNLLDGNCRFNQFDLVPGAQSVEGQVDFFVREHPKRKGVTTHFIAANDHEGWWVQKLGINIGKRMEESAAAAGRKDLRYLGYIEADVRLPAPAAAGETWIRVMHPGGGSAYAVSYVPQKIVESFQGGEKPALCLIGHHHKSEMLIYREVFCFQGGCVQDQTPFMRTRKIGAHLGGWIIEIEQAPDGHIASCSGEFKRFYDRGFYEGKEKYARW